MENDKREQAEGRRKITAGRQRCNDGSEVRGDVALRSTPRYLHAVFHCVALN